MSEKLKQKKRNVCPRSLKKNEKVSMESRPQESRKQNTNTRKKHDEFMDPFVCVHETVSECAHM
jgi:hypothetical protein